jgi:lysozyme family protein
VSFEQALKFVLEREGGYVNDPLDPGGETKYGISKKSYPNVDIRNLTPELAGSIYQADYWAPCGCDDRPAPLALVVFDTAVNIGTARAVAWLQQYPQVEDYLWHRLAYYRGLVQSKSSLSKFLIGWLRRLELLREAARQQS